MKWNNESVESLHYIVLKNWRVDQQTSPLCSGFLKGAVHPKMTFTCGLLWCFNQLFGLSFWRHPFTAEHPLVNKWCNATFLQIWWRNKLFYILHGLRESTCVFFGWTSPLSSYKGTAVSGCILTNHACDSFCVLVSDLGIRLGSSRG